MTEKVRQLEESRWNHVEAALSQTQWSDHAGKITRWMALADEFEPAGVVHHWARAVSRGDSREAERVFLHVIGILVFLCRPMADVFLVALRRSSRSLVSETA